MVSMGVGSKPFLDIQPSDAAISDRAVHCIMKSRGDVSCQSVGEELIVFDPSVPVIDQHDVFSGARTRASIAVSVFDHSNPFKRAAVTSDPGTSGPSSSSLLGPLNLHMYRYNMVRSEPVDGETPLYDDLMTSLTFNLRSPQPNPPTLLCS